MWHPRATKNAKQFDHKGLRQSEVPYPRCPRSRQTDVAGNELTRIKDFAVNEAQRAKISFKIGREISTLHWKPDEPYLFCLGWGQDGGVHIIHGRSGAGIVRFNWNDIIFIEILFYILSLFTL